MAKDVAGELREHIRIRSREARIDRAQFWQAAAGWVLFIGAALLAMLAGR
jgi:hypothetical protein